MSLRCLSAPILLALVVERVSRWAPLPCCESAPIRIIFRFRAEAARVWRIAWPGSSQRISG